MSRTDNLTETSNRNQFVILKSMIKRHELTDEQWERIKDLVPPERSGGKGRPVRDNRMMINAILWIVKTGAPWRDLPEQFDSLNSVYSRYSRWTKRGIWKKSFLELAKDQDNEAYMIDESYVQVHQHASGGKGGREKQGIGRSRVSVKRTAVFQPRLRSEKMNSNDILTDLRGLKST